MVNVQGDLPTLDPALLGIALRPLADPAVDIATLAAEITRNDERTNPNVVKVVGSPVGAVPPARALFHPCHGAVRARDRSIITSGFTPTAAHHWSGSSAAAITA